MSDHSTGFSARTSPERPDDWLHIAWRRSRPGLGAIALFSIFINLLKLAIPLYVLQILDRVVASRSLESLFMIITITVIAITCAVLLEVIRRRMLLHWGNWIECCFGPTLFTAGLANEPTESPTSSKLLRDIGTVRSFVSGSAIIAWIDAVWAPLFIGCVYLISPTLGYIVFSASLIALLLGVVSEYISRDSRTISYQARKDDRDWIASAERNHETVKSLNMALHFADRWSCNAFTKLDESMRGRNLHLYFSATMILVARFLRIAILGAGVLLVINQSLTLGSVIAANILGRMAYSLVQNAMLRWREVVTAKRAYFRIDSSLKEITRKHVSLPQNLNLFSLSLKNIRYRYPGHHSSIFRNLNLILDPGEMLLVVGPSASGKSTFARLVTGLLIPRDGNVRLGEVDVFRLQQENNGCSIGKLSQEISLFHGTVRENIARMSTGEMDMVVRAAKFAGIHDTIINLPAGYDTEIVENDQALSFGQRKGIALARAFYGNPKLVVLDEPFPHLDNKARSDLLKGIKRLNTEGAVIVITTQSTSLCKYADKALLLLENKHLLLNTPKEINSSLKTISLGHQKTTQHTKEKNDRARSLETDASEIEASQRSA